MDNEKQVKTDEQNEPEVQEAPVKKKKGGQMKPNGKFYKFSVILNFILAAIGFGIIALVALFTQGNIIGYIVCWVLFAAFAIYANMFIVTRTKLKTVYFLFGTIVNIIVFLVPSLLLILL